MSKLNAMNDNKPTEHRFYSKEQLIDLLEFCANGFKAEKLDNDIMFWVIADPEGGCSAADVVKFWETENELLAPTQPTAVEPSQPSTQGGEETVSLLKRVINEADVNGEIRIGNRHKLKRDIVEFLADSSNAADSQKGSEWISVDRAGVIALKIAEQIQPKLSVQEQAMFIAGVQEFVKYLNSDKNPELSVATMQDQGTGTPPKKNAEHLSQPTAVEVSGLDQLKKKVEERLSLVPDEYNYTLTQRGLQDAYTNVLNWIKEIQQQ